MMRIFEEIFITVVVNNMLKQRYCRNYFGPVVFKSLFFRLQVKKNLEPGMLENALSTTLVLRDVPAMERLSIVQEEVLKKFLVIYLYIQLNCKC